MKVEFRRRPTFDAIFGDANFLALVDQFKAHALVRGFLVTAVKENIDGPPANATFALYGRLWGTSHEDVGDEVAAEVEESGRLLDELYLTHGQPNPGNLRGAILEGLVMEALRPRYGHAELQDNTEITISNGVHYTSPPNQPLDVVGWDGALGECHDVKMRAGRLVAPFIQHLADGLPYPTFRLGIVTTMSRFSVAGALKAQGYVAPARVTFIAVEDLLDFVPLQQAA